MYKIIYEDGTTETLLLDDQHFIESMITLMLVKERMTKPVNHIEQY